MHTLTDARSSKTQRSGSVSKLTLVFREAIWVTLSVCLLFPQESNRHKRAPSRSPPTPRPYGGTVVLPACTEALPVEVMAVVRHCPLPHLAPSVWALSPARSTQMCVMQGLSGPPALPSLARSLTHSLAQLLPHLTSLRTTNFIRYSFKKDTSQLAACPDYTAKERERVKEWKGDRVREEIRERGRDIHKDRGGRGEYEENREEGH